MMLKKLGWVAAAMVIASSGDGIAQADSISDVENARAKDRAGYDTTRQDREKLRRYGRNDDDYGYAGGYDHVGDDYGYRYGGYAYDDDDGPYDGEGVSVYLGPDGDDDGGPYDD